MSLLQVPLFDDIIHAHGEAAMALICLKHNATKKWAPIFSDLLSLKFTSSSCILLHQNLKSIHSSP